MIRLRSRSERVTVVFKVFSGHSTAGWGLLIALHRLDRRDEERALRFTTLRTRRTSAAVFTLLCYRKLVLPNSVLLEHLYDIPIPDVNTLLVTTFLCTTTTMRYHICVCVLEVDKIYVEIAKPCFRDVPLPEAERITSQEDHAAIRLQGLFSAARQTSQRIAQRARVNTALHGRGSRFPPDPGPTERKGRRHISADSASFRGGLSASHRKTGCWPWDSRSSSRAALENVKEIADRLNVGDTVEGAFVQTRGRFGIYYLSEMRVELCDTLFGPFAETFE